MKITYSITASILIILLVILVFFYINSESNKLPFRTNPRYELTAYSLIHDQNNDSLLHLRGWLYATFNKKGYCMLVKKYDRFTFNHFSITDKSINQLNQYFTNAPVRLDLIHSGPPKIYDGPMLRLDYINNKVIKTIYFLDGDDSIYQRVFKEMDFWNTKKNTSINDTIGIKEMRYKMLTSIRNEIEAEFKMNSNFNWDILE